jgi:precorrin-2 dehydrogenase/sirohydrochlorin ferrochelatase
VKHKEPESGLTNTAEPKSYYPLFVNLRGKKVVVVGGGKVAERKILSLLKAGADVTVISPKITKKIENERCKGNLKLINRQYRNGDLDNAFLVIAATDCPVTNEKASKDAPCLLNVVDTPRLCNFIVPSTVNRGPLTIAVSTGGVSPALSRSIRRELEKEFGSEFAHYLESLRKIRAEAVEVIRDKRKRSRFLKALASDKLLEMLKEKGFKETKRIAEDLFKRAKTGS